MAVTDSSISTVVIKPIRVFIALPLTEEVKIELQKIQRELQGRTLAEPVRWLRPDQMHLTLRFFGNVMPAEISDLEAAMKPLCQGVQPFHLRLEKVGCFPDLKRPRVVWIGLSGDLEPLDRLQDCIRVATEAWGDNQESRAFQPHLTIGRVKSTKPQEIRPMSERLQTCIISPTTGWVVRQMDLVQSHLAPQGVNYTVLKSFDLGGPL